MKLRKPCEHGRYDAHLVEALRPSSYRDFLDKAMHEYYPKTDPSTYSPPDPVPQEDCPGGVFLPDDTLVVEKVNGQWPEWATDLDMVPYELTGIVGLLDDLYQRST